MQKNNNLTDTAHAHRQCISLKIVTSGCDELHTHTCDSECKYPRKAHDPLFQTGWWIIQTNSVCLVNLDCESIRASPAGPQEVRGGNKPHMIGGGVLDDQARREE